jgi:glucose-1-phosphate thymidylyltransferase
MKGVILAGGRGVRLRPLTAVANKHLLPVYDRPMIAYPIQTLRAAGLRDLMIVTGSEHVAEFRRVLGDGFAYASQPAAAGIADALRYAEEFAAGAAIAVVLGDNLFGSLQFKPFTAGARIFLKRVASPLQLGVAEFAAGKLTRLVEKPRQTRSRLAVTGLYLYDAEVFDIIRRLKPSRRGELEITDVNNEYLRRGKLRHEVLRTWWCDAGSSPAALLAAGVRVARQRGVRL